MGKSRRRSGGTQGSQGEQNAPYDYDTIQQKNNDFINDALVDTDFENIELEALEYEANQSRMLLNSINRDGNISLINPENDNQSFTVERSANRTLLLNREGGDAGLGDVISRINNNISDSTRNVTVNWDPYEEKGEGFIYRKGPDLIVNSAYVDGLSTSEVNELIDDYFNNYG